MEIWKDYDTYYEVSNLGQVRSKDRIVRSTYGGSYFKPGRILKQNDNGQGYLQVSLCYHGHMKTERVHRLVALVFIENPEHLPKVNHIDGNKRNNNAKNLEWCTQLQNVQHAVQMGLHLIGEDKPKSKLTEIEIREIKFLLSEGFTNPDIAKIFGVHPGTISCIRLGRNWSHIK